MIKAQWLDNAIQFLLCALVFLLPFSFNFTAYCIIGLTLCWLLQGNFKETFANIRNRKALWPWFLFYALHVISYTYSQNKEQSLFDLQAKLSLLIMPVVIGAGISINRKTIERIFFYFTCAITILGIACIAYAVYRCTQEGYIYWPFFFYHRLTEPVDPTAVYIALYTLLSIASLLFFIWEDKYTGKFKKYKNIVIVFQIIFFVLLSSRLLIVLLIVLMLPFYLRKLLYHSNISIPNMLAFSGTLVTIVLILFLTDNPVRKRFNDIFEKKLDVAWKQDYSHTAQKEFNNITLRLMLWRFGIDNMNEHSLWLTGAGNGDVVDLQNTQLATHGIDVYNTDPSKRSEFYNINLHNMWLQTLLMLGIFGVLVFCFITFPPLFYIRLIEYRHLFFIYHISILLFMFQEASFQTQSGIVYYSFFTTLFWNIYYTNRKPKNKLVTVTY
jgi:hypothetical protein